MFIIPIRSSIIITKHICFVDFTHSINIISILYIFLFSKFIVAKMLSINSITLIYIFI